jgi:aminopeptidase-like protein
MSKQSIGCYLHELAGALWPIARSITGPGVRQTLEILNNELSGQLCIHSVDSGTPAFDWTVPDEWTIRDAWVENELGERVIDFQANNLHLVGYSEPVDQWLELDELQQHLYSLPEQPEAIPYVTSYYKRRWGFCLSHNQRELLMPGRYRAVVDADLQPGVLNYGELIIPGNSDQEVFLSTYVCHPSMANNELSGPVVTTAIARWLQSLPDRRYTYRIVFIPETIGSLVYLSRNLEHLKVHVIAGFNVSCIGDDRCYSCLPSRAENTLADRAARHALHHIDPDYIRYTWLDRGSDERQYSAPGVDLPIATIMRSKYGMYPEYHTSLDDLNFVTPSGLEGGYRALKSAIEAIEINGRPRALVLGEPQLSKRGLYPTISQKGSAYEVKAMMDLLTYADGKRDLIEIADLIGVRIQKLGEIMERLIEHELISV